MIVDWNEVANVLENLYASSERLEELFPGRKFTLDGHLVGSIGEVVAAYMFDLNLASASSLGHDAVTRDGQQVEVKLTQGTSVAIRHEPAHLLVLHRPRATSLRIVFNGPGAIAWEAAGAKQANGQRPITLAKLSKLDAFIVDKDRLRQFRDPPI